MIGSGLGKGYRRAAGSPLDEVRFHLGIILVVGLLMILLVGRLTDEFWLQVLLLALYGSGSALWIVLRVRRVLRASEQR